MTEQQSRGTMTKQEDDRAGGQSRTTEQADDDSAERTTDQGDGDSAEDR